MKNIQLVFSMTVIALEIALIAAMSMGRYPIHLSTIAKLPFSIFGGAESNALTGQTILVLWSVRLSRMLMALMTGAALAVAGVVFQGLFKNPLVSPAILGVTAGANFGAALAMLMGGSAMMLQTSAFIWGLVAVGTAYLIGRQGDHSVTTLVLAGVIVSALFMAGLSYIKCNDPAMIRMFVNAAKQQPETGGRERCSGTRRM
ncbi:hypothetical protein DSCO28_44160 [Desulfosarcina ovata subsp. sediminis]|uniref:Iron ABC transporter permease n=1 Tax=Desulfosarcina ovata subsp. sediminis TaxID=885957 RepID=A0A5K7ZUH1_9BACT|nr:iron chelate uptake ABC transporter family permease subunit [Desulfosarcina ovata]BBO83850.1 hypothetical protein DSCO28_44160 [Desulfosarcina ovata subsp. sediminis]